jgi:hypothetical protein
MMIEGVQKEGIRREKDETKGQPMYFMLHHVRTTQTRQQIKPLLHRRRRCRRRRRRRRRVSLANG